jgi:hypothetical protein
VAAVELELKEQRFSLAFLGSVLGMDQPAAGEAPACL